jgi:hypothetical protein
MKSFNLGGGKGVRLIYGPEIGASGKNKIKLSIDVEYVDPKSGEKKIESYSGTLDYDINTKQDYLGDEFRNLDPSTSSRT